MASEQEPDWMEPEGEVDDDAEVPAAAAESPEEVGVLLLARRDDIAVSRDHCGTEQVVERESVRRRQVPDAAAQRQAGNARVTEGSARRCESMALTGRVEVLPERAAAAPRRPGLRIDDDLAHQTQVDDKTPVADAMTGDAVTAAAYGHRQTTFARELESRDDIIDIERPRDQLRVPFDHPVERGSCNLEVSVSWSDDRSSMLLPQLSRRRHAPP